MFFLNSYNVDQLRRRFDSGVSSVVDNISLGDKSTDVVVSNHNFFCIGSDECKNTIIYNKVTNICSLIKYITPRDEVETSDVLKK
jgi:hypothetical protein